MEEKGLLFPFASVQVSITEMMFWLKAASPEASHVSVPLDVRVVHPVKATRDVTAVRTPELYVDVIPTNHDLKETAELPGNEHAVVPATQVTLTLVSGAVVISDKETDKGGVAGVARREKEKVR